MTGVGFLILFGLSCVFFSCEGQVSPPSYQNITFLPGSNATLKWTFVGDPSKAFLFWYFTRRSGSMEENIAVKIETNAATIRNSSLPGVAIETPATLVLKNVDQRYNGKYRFSVQVSGGGGDASVEVFIAVTPNITVYCPNATTLTKGDNFTCVCRGEGGNPRANVTWYKDGEQIVTGTEIAILSLIDVDEDDAGTYRCEARSHEKAKKEIIIEIIVNYPPENVTLTLRRNGDNVTITCNAEARPAPGFEIFLNQTKLIRSDKTYNIPKVDTSHVGNYSCVAWNFLGNKTSNSEYLSLEEQRILLPPGGNILPVLSGSTKKIEWVLYPRTPYPTNMYRSWTFKSSRGGKDEFLGEISRSGRIKIFTKLYEVDIKSPATLVLKNVNGSYNGTYEFTLESYSTVISKVEVFIAAEPNVTINCSSPITIDEGDDLTCVGRSEGGNPPANVTWYKDGNQQISNASYGENSLTLTNVGKQDIGTYKCVAQSYTLMDEESIEVIVTLNFKPENTTITNKTESNVVGNSATITCSSKGRPEPWYNITHNDTMLVSTSETYTISETKLRDSGKYTCFAWNKVGNDSASGYLTLTVKPDSDSDSDSDSKTCGWWCILLIVIAVLVVLMIISYVVYRYKQKEKDGGYRGNADVSPGASGGLAENQYELDGEPSGGVDNTYDTVNNPGASGSKKKPPENTTPDVYAAVDKKNREGKPLYATLDSLALEQADNSKKKRDEERPGQTEYASIDFAKIGKADQE